MTNSPMVTYVKLSPNHSGKRNHVIDRITVHYMDGDLSVETCGEIFAAPSRRASSNYGIGSDGRIALYVDESNRSWCSGSSYNDNRAVTIECANLAGGALSDRCWNSLIELCADICRRNGIERLVYTGDDSGNLTKHKWYDNTDCPGPWLDTRFGAIARQVNEKLGQYTASVPHPTGFGGTYRCTVDGLCVRTKPSTTGGKVAFYSKGMTVVLDDWYTSADEYIWGRYTAASGNVRYVAVGRDTGKVEPDDYLVKVD